MTHYMFHSSTFTTAVQNHECYLMHLRIKTNIPKQSNKVHPVHSYSQSVVNQQPQHQVPPCLQCHDGSYFSLSLSALECLNCPANQTASNSSSKVTSANVRQAPLFLHTTEPQVFHYSRLISMSHSHPTHVLIQLFHLAKLQPDPPGSYFLFHEPRSLPKHSLTLQVPTFLYPSPGMTPSSVAPRTVHSVRPGSTTT